MLPTKSSAADTGSAERIAEVPTLAADLITPRRTTRPRRSEVLWPAIGTVLLLAGAYRVFAFVQDDAFITYRYAWNLRHGFGPVFNAGERTEGYSCPLYMALTALGMLMPGDALFRAKLFGLLCGAGAVWALWLVACELELPYWARAAAPVALGASGSAALAAVDGMETALQTLLVTVAALLFVREQRPGGGKPGLVSSVLFLAAALNRPEGLLLFGGALAARVLSRRRQGSPIAHARGEIAWIALFAVPYFIFLLWRRAYYGDWLPNTYYAKNIPLLDALAPSLGPSYLVRTLFVNLNGRMVAAGVSMLLWTCAIAGAISPRFRRSGGLVVPFLVLAQALFALRAGGDWMPGWRYMDPVLPLWLLLVLAGLAQAASELQGKASARPAPVADIAGWMGAAGLVLLCLWTAGEFGDPAFGAVSWSKQAWACSAAGLFRGTRMTMTVVTGDVLNRTLHGGDVVAFSEIGAVPYFTPKLRWIDTYGLTDHEIGHMESVPRFRTGVTGDYTDAATPVGSVLLRRRPDYVIRWLSASAPALPILDGTYVPWMRVPVDSLTGASQTMLQVWKRRG